jgi:hypothetical protein
MGRGPCESRARGRGCPAVVVALIRGAGSAVAGGGADPAADRAQAALSGRSGGTPRWLHGVLSRARSLRRTSFYAGRVQVQRHDGAPGMCDPRVPWVGSRCRGASGSVFQRGGETATSLERGPEARRGSPQGGRGKRPSRPCHRPDPLWGCASTMNPGGLGPTSRRSVVGPLLAGPGFSRGRCSSQENVRRAGLPRSPGAMNRRTRGGVSPPCRGARRLPTTAGQAALDGRWGE